MILLYVLFALTVSTVLIALFSDHIPQKREGEAFIGFFIALMVLAWAADEWLLPSLSTGVKAFPLSILLLIVFGGLFAASAILSVRTPNARMHGVVNHEKRLNAESVAFDLVLWLSLLTLGIMVLRSVGMYA